MKLNKLEFYYYILLIVGTLVLVLLPVMLYDQPNTSIPQQIDPDTPDLPETTIDRPPQARNNLFSKIFDILLIIAVVIGLLILFSVARSYLSYYRKNRLKKLKQKDTSLKEKVGRLKDARNEAYKIIEQGLQNKTYTKSFIEAYLALDNSLNSFRKIQRPKFWTPKEYAFNVSPPVFKASVYRFVSIFYDLRYGLKQANRVNLEEFKQQLDYLFIDDVPDHIREEWSKFITQEIRDNYSFKINRITDFTSPRRSD